MAKRPPLSEQSFLAHLFGPKRNPQPSGIRRTSLTGLKGGRKSARLASFNRMSPVNQELLKQAGLRDAYLRGDAKLSDAKAALRPRGIQLGVAKPLRGGRPNPVNRMTLDERVALHLKSTIRAEQRLVNEFTVDRNVRFIPSDVLPEVEHWDYGQIKWAGRPESEYEFIDQGHKRNPFWYH